MGRLSPPVGVGLKNDGRARIDTRDPVGAVIQTGLGWVAIIGVASAVGRRIRRGLAFEVGGDDLEVIDRLGLADALVPEDCEVPVVPCLDLLHPAVELLVVDACGLIAADLPGEQHVFRGQRYTVAPSGTFANCVVDGEPVLAVRRGPVSDHAVFARWQNLTQQADQIPVCVIDRERPPAHAEDQRQGHMTGEIGMEALGELADADDQFVFGRVRRPGAYDGQKGGHGCGGENDWRFHGRPTILLREF